MKGRGEDTSAVMAEVGGLGDEMKTSAALLDDIQKRLSDLLLGVPNLPHESVPAGRNEADNVEVRRWGTPRQFDFGREGSRGCRHAARPRLRDRCELSGARFTMLRGPIARLHRALAQFMIDTHTQQHGYTEIYTPYIVKSGNPVRHRPAAEIRRRHVPRRKGGGENTITQYLISTSEISLTNTVRESIVEASALPIKLTAHSPCFPLGSWIVRSRYAWHDSSASVRQG